jgi:MFS family permease
MNRKWSTLVGTCSGLFLLMLDSTVVALALPSIRTDIGATSAGLQWIMNGYLLVITVLVVTAGRLGDMFGRKRIFLAGTVAFAVGSAVSGAANDELTLILGRVLQGIGAASHLGLRARRRAPQARSEAPPLASLSAPFPRMRPIRLTNSIPISPLGYAQTAFQSDICHPRIDVRPAWG